MATMVWYSKALYATMNKEIDYNSDDIRLMMLSSSYAYSDAHDYLDDVVANEISGTNWAAGGVTLGSPTITYSAGPPKTVTFDAADVSVSTVTLAAFRYGVIYNRTPASNATRPLIGYIDWLASLSATAQTVAVSWPTAGILVGTIT